MNILKGNCCLVIGHPGHELGVWGWVRKMKPIVAILTDGSGNTNHSRLALSKTLLEKHGAIPSHLFGLVTDKDLYQFILSQNMELFFEWSDALANIFIDNNVRVVVGDMIEGYNPTHDLCHLMIDKAIKICLARNHAIKNYEYCLVGSPKPEILPPGHLQLALTSTDLQDKLSDAFAYTSLTDSIVKSEIEHMVQQYGKDIYGVEYLLPCNTMDNLAQFEKEKPYYEVYGEKQVAKGIYKSVIRYKEHIAPIVHALRQDYHSNHKFSDKETRIEELL